MVGRYKEAYAEKRSIYTQWSSQQISKGKFQTRLERISTVDESTGKEVTKNIPVSVMAAMTCQCIWTVILLTMELTSMVSK